MMWGPAVARAAAELALTGSTEVVDVSDLGLDRFDAEGRSRLATDPIALPFPGETTAAGSDRGSAWRLMHPMDARAPTRSRR